MVLRIPRLSPSQLPSAALAAPAVTPVLSPVFTHSFPCRPATIPGGPEVWTHPTPTAQQVLGHLYLAQGTGGSSMNRVVRQREVSTSWHSLLNPYRLS